MDKIAATYNPADPVSIEFHGSHILGGKGYWRHVPFTYRSNLIKELLDIIVRSHVSNRLFLCVVNKSLISPRDAVEYTFEQLANSLGHSWGILRNLSEVPLFIDSKASRLIQMADIIAYSAFQYYERGDDQYYKIFKSRIDTENGIMHGLYENI